MKLEKHQHVISQQEIVEPAQGNGASGGFSTLTQSNPSVILRRESQNESASPSLPSSSFRSGLLSGSQFGSQGGSQGGSLGSQGGSQAKKSSSLGKSVSLGATLAKHNAAVAVKKVQHIFYVIDD